MSHRREHRTLTPAQVREQMAGAQRLGPGVWLDRQGYVHFSVPEILKHLGLPDTPEHRDLVNRTAAEMIATLAPDAVIVENELEN
jgi:hypothetical protein